MNDLLKQLEAFKAQIEKQFGQKLGDITDNEFHFSIFLQTGSKPYFQLYYRHNDCINSYGGGKTVDDACRNLIAALELYFHTCK